MNTLLSALSGIWNGNLAAGYKSPRLIVPGLERSALLQVRDLRPATEKEAKTFSRFVASSAFGTYRVPDSMIAPTPARLLQHLAYQSFGDIGVPFDIVIQHLVVYRNQKAQFRRGAVGMGIGGGIGGAIAAALSARTSPDSSDGTTSLFDPEVFESLAGREYERAFLTDDDAVGSAGAHLVYIDTVINDKRIFTRTIMPLKTKANLSPLTAAVAGSINFHMSQYTQADFSPTRLEAAAA